MSGGWQWLGILLLLQGGCVPQAVYLAKAEEVEQLKSREQLVQQRLGERIDRLSARLSDLEKEIGKTEPRWTELSAAMQLVRDLAVQTDQNLLKLLVQRDTRCDCPSAPPKTPPPPGRGQKTPPLFPSKRH